MPADNSNNGLEFVLIDPEHLGDFLGSLAAMFEQPVTNKASEIGDFLDMNEGKSLGKIMEEALARQKRHSEPFETDDNGAVLAYNNLKIVHISDPEVRNAGMTVCYREPQGYNGYSPRTFEVATAIVHPNDTFSKKEGTAIAMKNFLDGKTVLLPTISGCGVIDSIKEYFGAMFYA